LIFLNDSDAFAGFQHFFDNIAVLLLKPVSIYPNQLALMMKGTYQNITIRKTLNQPENLSAR